MTAQAAQALRPAATPSPVNHTAPAVAAVGGGSVPPPVDDSQARLGVLLSGMGDRLHMAEQHTTSLEARCTLLDSLLQQLLESTQHDGVRTMLQMQAQLYDIAASLQHLLLRVDVLERRVTHAVEEGEGRLESVLGALVGALRQQDVMAAHEAQVAELRAAVAELARKLEAVEGAGAVVGRVGSPRTPKGGGTAGGMLVGLACMMCCHLPNTQGRHRGSCCRAWPSKSWLHGLSAGSVDCHFCC